MRRQDAHSVLVLMGVWIVVIGLITFVVSVVLR